MKELETEPEIDIKSILAASVPQDTEIQTHITEIGEVIYVGDGICKIKNLPNARIDDMVRIEAKGETISCLILGLTHETVEAVVLGDYTKISKGDPAHSSRRRVSIPTGAEIMGRVIDPLGHPIDGKGELKSKKSVPIEIPAPPVFQREQIHDQIRTGVLVVDSIIPVGKGQRELIVGDRKTGKTTLAANIISNQKGKNIFCVYVSIGGKKAKIKGIIEDLERRGAMEYTVVVLATADDSPSINYIAPYSGCAIAEQFMKTGQDAIVIYDDLSKHAKQYRQMSLLLKRSPGRDAYPGDIFYLHSRLLERSAHLSMDYTGGSSTAFPIAETQSGDISEYITTNLMSITDGHIYLDVNLKNAGILPPVDSGFSVSRIGGSIQTKLLRKLSEIAGGQLQRYNEVKSYENLNTEITAETEREIKRGKRILEIFNQQSHVNLSVEEEVLILYIVTAGKIDDMDLKDVKKLKHVLLVYARDEANTELRAKLGDPKLTTDDIKEQMDQIFTLDTLQALILETEKKETMEKEKLASEEPKEEELIPAQSESVPPTDPAKLEANDGKQVSPELILPEGIKNEKPIGVTFEKQPVSPFAAGNAVPSAPNPAQSAQSIIDPHPHMEGVHESPIEELGEVINQIPDEEPNIKVIEI